MPRTIISSKGFAASALAVIILSLGTPLLVFAQEAPSSPATRDELLREALIPVILPVGPVGTLSFVGQQTAQISAGDSQNSCSNLKDFTMSWITCSLRAIAVFISSFLISLTAWLLALSGLLFDWLVLHTIVQFGAAGEMYSIVKPGVEIAWTVFRDLSNIVIIGMFAFIAISFILGTTYGKKEMVARVLVVTILINFSLLFTKIVIDASNFTARQFHQNVVRDNPGARSVADRSMGAIPLLDSYANVGIAGSFIGYMGITSIGNTYNALRARADENSGWMVLVYGVFGAVVLLGVALVLLYGSFLLVSRALMLIFLLLTSSLAFASYLIPKFSEGEYGWKKWWDSLLKTALFAPLLMVFLWVTLTIANAIKNDPKEGGSLGTLFTNPGMSNVGALFSYLIILGLLFASFKAANMFSKSISGFRWAQMVPAIGVGLAARGAAAAATFGIGGAAMGASRGLTGIAKVQANKGNVIRARMLDTLGQGVGKVGKRDFNIANTGVYKRSISGPAGLKGAFAGETKYGGKVGREDRTKKKAAERAERLTYTDDELKATRLKALEEAGFATEGERAELKKILAAGTKPAPRVGPQPQIGAPDATKVKEAGDRKATVIERKETVTKEKAELDKKAEDMRTDARPINVAINESKANIAMKESLGMPTDKERADLKKNETLLKQQDEKIKQTVEKGNVIPYAKRRLDTAMEFAHTRLTNLPFVAYGQSVDNDRIAQEMRKAIVEHDESKIFKKQLAELSKISKQLEVGEEGAEERHAEERRRETQEARRMERTIRESGRQVQQPESGKPPGGQSNP